MTTVPSELDVDPMVALLHEARCGPENAEHLPWTDDHREWDVATVKALRLLGVAIEAEARADALDVAAQRIGDYEPKPGHEGIVWVPYDLVRAILAERQP